MMMTAIKKIRREKTKEQGMPRQTAVYFWNEMSI
jgi:hypothetical protein